MGEQRSEATQREATRPDAEADALSLRDGGPLSRLIESLRPHGQDRVHSSLDCYEAARVIELLVRTLRFYGKMENHERSGEKFGDTPGTKVNQDGGHRARETLGSLGEHVYI